MASTKQASASNELGKLIVNAAGAPVFFGDRKVSSPRNAITEQSGTITVGDDTTAFKVTLEYTVQGSEMTFKLDSKPFAIVSIDGPSKGKTPVSDIKIEKKLTVVELKKPGQETGMSIRLRFDGK